MHEHAHHCTGSSADLIEIKRVLEAALLVAGEPVALAQLARLFDPPIEQDTVRKLLDELKSDWQDRKVELVQVASGWRFQGTSRSCRPISIGWTRPSDRRRYSRAVMETLAIIAYRQPVTRGDIESIRGVAVSTNIVKSLEDRQWVEVVGHRETPGHPALYATTRTFLDDLRAHVPRRAPTVGRPRFIPPPWRCPIAPAKAAEAALASLAKARSSAPTQQLRTSRCEAMAESMPLPRHKSSTSTRSSTSRSACTRCSRPAASARGARWRS